MDNSTNYNSRLKSSLNINSYGKVHALCYIHADKIHVDRNNTKQNF